MPARRTAASSWNVAARVNQLREELDLEGAHSAEAERSLRRGWEVLDARVRTMQTAFDALTDSIIGEFEDLRATFHNDHARLAQRQMDLEEGVLRDMTGAGAIARRRKEQQDLLEMTMRSRYRDIEARLLQEVREAVAKDCAEHLSAHVETWQQREQARQHAAAVDREQRNHEVLRSELQAELRAEVGAEIRTEIKSQIQEVTRRADIVSRDHSTVLAAIPTMEETMLKGLSKLQERLNAMAFDMSSTSDSMAAERGRSQAAAERLETKLEALDTDLRKELQERHARFQQNVTRQLDSMSQALILGRVHLVEDASRRDDHFPRGSISASRSANISAPAVPADTSLYGKSDANASAFVADTSVDESGRRGRECGSHTGNIRDVRCASPDDPMGVGKFSVGASIFSSPTTDFQGRWPLPRRPP